MTTPNYCYILDLSKGGKIVYISNNLRRARKALAMMKQPHPFVITKNREASITVLAAQLAREWSTN